VFRGLIRLVGLSSKTSLNRCEAGSESRGAVGFRAPDLDA
jgi:hypothetical protein